MTVEVKSGHNYNCCKTDYNLCDGGSDLICVVRRQRVKNVEGNNNFTTAFTKCSSGKAKGVLIRVV